MALNFANNNSLSAITTLPASITGGALTLLQTQTASASASLEFSMDSTYDSYVFKFINIHPSANARFQFNGSIDNGSNYNVTKTTTAFWSAHNEANSDSNIFYRTSEDLAQSTSDQLLTIEVGNFTGNDEHYSGTLQIFNPSSTTFVKHFIVTGLHYGSTYALNSYVAGYFNTTSSLTNLIFRMSSGNIDDGIIKMYGVA
jgi:hypothetical protein